MTTFDKSHRTARQKADLPKLTIHGLRHTFASLALQSGSDVGAAPVNDIMRQFFKGFLAVSV